MTAYGFSQCFDSYESAWTKLDAELEGLIEKADPGPKIALEGLREQHTQPSIARIRKLRSEIASLAYGDARKRGNEFLSTSAVECQSRLNSAWKGVPDRKKPEYDELSKFIAQLEKLREEASLQIEETEQKLCVTFFDTSNPGKAIFLAQDTNYIEVKIGGIKNKYPIHGSGEKEPQYIELPGILMRAVEDAVKAYEEKKHEKAKGQPTIDIRLSEPYQDSCKRYTSATINLLAQDVTRACCCIPIPLYLSPETCSITLRSFDASLDDYIVNARDFQNEVEWNITSVEAPPITQHGSQSKFQPWSSSARSENARATISEVPLHQLYRIEARAPDGYRTEGPAVLHRYICCEQNLSITTYFKPCAKQATRSLIFVRGECPGTRWADESVNVGGLDLKISSEGILHLPADLTGVCTLYHPEKAFSPAVIDLASTPTVSVIAVSDQGADWQMGKGQTLKAQFVDHDDVPFKRRPIVFVLPDGSEARTMTDEQGWFEGRKGAKFYFPEHGSAPATGSAIEPLILISTESE